ncbi:uncharacterized protein [Choristoneura fumiferana]|uniref:uncharacterized protein n=1 Tax=Choristoneura fumiferana TaxID=7141 RepID=UPI003D1565D8
MLNVQCQYDSPEDRPDHDHTYDTRDEPPAFIIHQVTSPQVQAQPAPFVEVSPNKLMTLAPGNLGASVNVIHVGESNRSQSQSNQSEYININKRIRRSEVVLRQAADCVSRGQTFQTVSHQFNIPISTIRFFMARKGILPQRRRGRSTLPPRPCTSPEPPFHMQHYKLPDMIALRDGEQDSNE